MRSRSLEASSPHLKVLYSGIGMDLAPPLKITRAQGGSMKLNYFFVLGLSLFILESAAAVFAQPPLHDAMNPKLPEGVGPFPKLPPGVSPFPQVPEEAVRPLKARIMLEFMKAAKANGYTVITNGTEQLEEDAAQFYDLSNPEELERYKAMRRLEFDRENRRREEPLYKILRSQGVITPKSDVKITTYSYPQFEIWAVRSSDDLQEMPLLLLSFNRRTHKIEEVATFEDRMEVIKQEGPGKTPGVKFYGDTSIPYVNVKKVNEFRDGYNLSSGRSKKFFDFTQLINVNECVYCRTELGRFDERGQKRFMKFQEADEASKQPSESLSLKEALARLQSEDQNMAAFQLGLASAGLNDVIKLIQKNNDISAGEIVSTDVELRLNAQSCEAR